MTDHKRTVTLSTFPGVNDERCYWQVFVGGMPVTRETESQAQATAAFKQTCADMTTHGRTVRRTFWNGYDAVETAL